MRRRHAWIRLAGVLLLVPLLMGAKPNKRTQTKITDSINTALNEVLHTPVPEVIAPLVTLAENADLIALSYLNISLNLKLRKLLLDPDCDDKQFELIEQMLRKADHLKAERSITTMGKEQGKGDPWAAALLAHDPFSVPGSMDLHSRTPFFLPRSNEEEEMVLGPGIILPRFLGSADMNTQATVNLTVTFAPTAEPDQVALGMSSYTLTMGDITIPYFGLISQTDGQLNPWGSAPSGTLDTSTGLFEMSFEGLFTNGLLPASQPGLTFASIVGRFDEGMGEAIVFCDDPILVPAPVGIVPEGQPQLMGAHLFSFDATTHMLQLLENTSRQPGADIAMVRYEDGSYTHTEDEALGARVIVDPMELLTVGEADAYRFADTPIRIEAAEGLLGATSSKTVLLTGVLRNVVLDFTLGMFYADLEITGGEGSRAIWEITLHVDSAGFLMALGAAALDLEGMTLSFTESDTLPVPAIFHLGAIRNGTGPLIRMTADKQLQDSFPRSGTLDVSTPEGRNALDVPLDIAWETGEGLAASPGDSIVVAVAPMAPGAGISNPSDQIHLAFVVDKNPLFEDAFRVELFAYTQTVVPGGALNGWDQHFGIVQAQVCRDEAGYPVPHHYFFDLPDEDCLYPGDVLRYYVCAQDDLGHTATLPEELEAFDSGLGPHGQPYARPFTMHALPSSFDVGGSQPSILVVEESGSDEEEDLLVFSMGQLGAIEGQEYDVYTVNSPSSCFSNGIGSAGLHGATATQLAGYSFILYCSGSLPCFTLSDGSGMNGNDNGDDLGALLAWNMGIDHRKIAYLGSNLAYSLQQQGPVAQQYLAETMGVQYVQAETPAFGLTEYPQVAPTGSVPFFSSDLVLERAMPDDVDWIEPLALAETSHEFLGPGGAPGTYTAAAGVWHERIEGTGFLRIDAFLPFTLSAIGSVLNKTGQPSMRAEFLRELLEDGFGAFLGGSSPTPVADTAPRFGLAQNRPNPFNPATEISFSVDKPAKVLLTVYSVAGRRIRTLVDTDLPAGSQVVRWDGTDEAGHSVASGVYVYQLHVGTQVESRRMVLLR